MNILGFGFTSTLPLPYPAPEGEALMTCGLDSRMNYGAG